MIKEKVLVDIYDKNGYFMYQTDLPFSPEIIRNGFVYNIEINDETNETKIKRFKIANWIKLKEALKNNSIT